MKPVRKCRRRARSKIAGRPRAAGAAPAPRPAGREELDTSYICVVDKDGNAFSGTPSDGSSSAPVIPGLGIVPSTRGSQNNTDPNHPACLAPGKRPRLTPNPAMAIRDGRWMMPFGSPGNDVQIQAMTQVLMNMLVFGMTPQDAVEAPRFASYSYPRSSAPFSYSPGELRVESRIEASVADDLAARGHVMKPWSDWEYPGRRGLHHRRRPGNRRDGRRVRPAPPDRRRRLVAGRDITVRKAEQAILRLEGARSCARTPSETHRAR